MSQSKNICFENAKKYKEISKYNLRRKNKCTKKWYYFLFIANKLINYNIANSYLVTIFADKDYHSRIYFMIKDVVELKENDWVPRRQVAKPKRIKDIHHEHAREEQGKKTEAAIDQQIRKR